MTSTEPRTTVVSDITILSRENGSNENRVKSVNEQREKSVSERSFINTSLNNETETRHTLDINGSAISLWHERWFLSSNAKDIGVLYLIYALFSGLVGTAFSVLIRLELSGPGVQFIADNQLYNSIITAHAIIMIFFMVKKYYILSSHVTFLRSK